MRLHSACQLNIAADTEGCVCVCVCVCVCYAAHGNPRLPHACCVGR